MKLAIRRGVFETNSSSTHSVSLIGRDPRWDHSIVLADLPELEELKVNDEYDKVEADFGQFGWGPDCFNAIDLKLSYALTMVACTECRYIRSSIDFFESEGFKMINDAIANRYHCKGVFITSDINVSDYLESSKGSDMKHIVIDGYIDHASGSDEYSSLKDFLDENDLDIDNFLFNKEVVVFIKNDNTTYDDEYDDHFKSHINDMGAAYWHDEDEGDDEYGFEEKDEDEEKEDQ